MDYRNRSSRRKIVLLRNALPSKPVAEMSQKRRRVAPKFALSSFCSTGDMLVSSAGNGRIDVGQ
jgi:hypothetical protein